MRRAVGCRLLQLAWLLRATASFTSSHRRPETLLAVEPEGLHPILTESGSAGACSNFEEPGGPSSCRRRVDLKWHVGSTGPHRGPNTFHDSLHPFSCRKPLIVATPIGLPFRVQIHLDNMSMGTWAL